MISFIALALYMTVLVIVMFYSVIEVDNHPLALLQAVVMVAITSGIPALLGMLNGMNYERKHPKA
jgi:uncharacterized protein YqhQ